MTQGEQKKSPKADNRGQVKHPATDGRLKGNEANRPNDPSGSGRVEGGRKGGLHSHDGDNKR